MSEHTSTHPPSTEPSTAVADPPRADDAAYVLESVSKTYGRGRTASLPAITDLTVTVPRGRITVVVGPSGSGRTTLLRLLNRTIDPTTGTISVDGLPLRRHRRSGLRRQVGTVLQGSGLLPRRTVAENLAAAARRAGVRSREIDDRIDTWLARVGLTPRDADALPVQLTSGNLQRVKLASALVGEPDVLLLDEPFALLDQVARRRLQALLLQVQGERRMTVVLTTQDLDEAVRLADEVVVLGRGGRLLQHAEPAEVLHSPAGDEVEAFLARDRGWRGLSFHPADQLPVVRVRAVRTPTAVRHGGEALVLDAQARPRGWVTPERPGQVVRLGGTFDPHRDSLRTALDAALESPVGCAVSVESGTGRFTGAVRLEAITEHIAELRRTVSISVLDAAAAERRRKAEAARKEAAERARRYEAERARMLAEMADSGGSTARTRRQQPDSEPAGRA